MRINEIIVEQNLEELFRNPTTTWEWNFQESDECEASFTIGKIPYIWSAFCENIKLGSWEILFTIDTRYAVQHDLNPFGLNATGNSAQVMSVVVDITKSFLRDYGKDIQELTFSAEEDSRLKLYAKMVKRLLPNWGYNEVGGHFILIRPA